MEMLLAVLSVCSPEELEGGGSSSEDEVAERTLIDQATTPDARATRRQQIRNKILAVGRLQFMFQNLRYHRWTYIYSLGQLTTYCRRRLDVVKYKLELNTPLRNFKNLSISCPTTASDSLYPALRKTSIFATFTDPTLAQFFPWNNGPPSRNVCTSSRQ